MLSDLFKKCQDREFPTCPFHFDKFWWNQRRKFSQWGISVPMFAINSRLFCINNRCIPSPKLTLWGHVAHKWVSKAGHHWFRQWLVAWTAPSHYLTQWWNNVNWTLGNKFQWNLNRTIYFLTKTRQIWGIWKLRPAYSPEMPNMGQNRWCFVPCDLEIWWMTLENNRASLLCCFKLCATFHSHWWIQSGVTVRKRPIWVKFDDF